NPDKSGASANFWRKLTEKTPRFNIFMKTYLILIVSFLLMDCSQKKAAADISSVIAKDDKLEIVKKKAREVVGSGFSAGDDYREVWIRDYNTFITLAAEVH